MELWAIGRESPFDPGEKAESLDFLRVILNAGITQDQAEYINKDRLASLILLECGNMKPLVNNPLVFQSMAVAWLQSRSEQFQHLLEALFENYSPYEDFREHEITVLDGRLKTDDTRNITRGETTQNNGSYNNTGHTDDVTETSVSADNESTYQPRERVGRTVDDTLANTHSDTTTDNETKADILNGLKKTDDTTTREFYGHKNSNQTLALQELEVAQNNLYDMIIKWWTDALFIGIYD